MKVLQIDTSILGEKSLSRQLTASVIQQITVTDPQAEVVYRDFALAPIPHLSDTEFFAWQGVEPNDEAGKQLVVNNSQYLDEFLALMLLSLVLQCTTLAFHHN